MSGVIMNVKLENLEPKVAKDSKKKYIYFGENFTIHEPLLMKHAWIHEGETVQCEVFETDSGWKNIRAITGSPIPSVEFKEDKPKAPEPQYAPVQPSGDIVRQPEVPVPMDKPFPKVNASAPMQGNPRYADPRFEDPSWEAARIERQRVLETRHEPIRQNSRSFGKGSDCVKIYYTNANDLKEQCRALVIMGMFPATEVQDWMKQ
jgi:hypothetical protein